MSANPFAREPETIDTAIATVERAALEEASSRGVAAPIVRQLAAESVASYWPRPVRTFIPILALREMREWLHGRSLPVATGDIRPLSLLLAAHRFLGEWSASAHRDTSFRQAASSAAIYWCGAGPDRVAARSAFFQVATALRADGGEPLADPDVYVALVSEVLGSAERHDIAAETRPGSISGKSSNGHSRLPES